MCEQQLVTGHHPRSTYRLRREPPRDAGARRRGSLALTLDGNRDPGWPASTRSVIRGWRRRHQAQCCRYPSTGRFQGLVRRRMPG